MEPQNSVAINQQHTSRNKRTGLHRANDVNSSIRFGHENPENSRNFSRARDKDATLSDRNRLNLAVPCRRLSRTD